MGQAIQEAGLKKIALLGTKFTMDAPFYRNHLAERYGSELPQIRRVLDTAG